MWTVRIAPNGVPLFSKQHSQNCLRTSDIGHNESRNNMAYSSLRDFVKELEQAGELKRIKAEVSPNLEITQITDRVSKAEGPALLFENVEGSDMPLLINAFGSYKRMAMALEIGRAHV